MGRSSHAGGDRRYVLSACPDAALIELETLALEDPPIEIVEGLIRESDRVLQYGYSGSCKSILSREMAIAIHLGKPFLGRFRTAQRRVGLIDEESSAAHLGVQLALIRRAHLAGDGDLPVFAVRQGYASMTRTVSRMSRGGSPTTSSRCSSWTR